MRLDVLRGAAQRVHIADVAQAVFYDCFDQPCAAVVEIESGRITLLVKGMPGFEDALRLLGIEPGQVTVMDVAAPQIRISS